MIHCLFVCAEFPVKESDQQELVSYPCLPPSTQRQLLKARLKDYCKKAYHKTHETVTIMREGFQQY
jgi:hypothetical protein